MHRSLSLTLLLMAGSVAAAVAAPDLGPGAYASGCSETRTVTSGSASAAPFKPHRPMVVPVAARATADASASPCALDVTEPYRNWHHGSAKLVAGCGAMSST